MFDLHTDWKRIFKRAHSIRWMISAMVFGGLESGFSIYSSFAGAPPFGMPIGAFAGASMLCTALAFWARLQSQKGFHDA